MQFLLYLFFTSLWRRNIPYIKYKNCVDFHCLFPYPKDSRQMQREQILWGIQCMFWYAHAKLITFSANCVPNFHVSSPHPLNKLCRLFDCVSSTVYRSPYCNTVLNADGRIHTVTCAPFYLFSFTRFYIFSHLRILFSPFSYFSFIPNFTRASFIAHDFILLRASLDTTISLSVSVLIRLNPRVSSGFWQLIHLFTFPEKLLSGLFVHVRMVTS